MAQTIATTIPNPNHSIFRSALDKYIEQLDRKKLQKKKFVASCLHTAGSNPTAEMVNSLIRANEENGAQSQRRKTVARVLGPVVGVLKDFDQVVSSLASADPMPSSIIWAALSVIVKGAHRYIELFEKIRRQLNDLRFEIERMVEYEDLYGSSENLRVLLCDSYMSLFRFWSAVEKQCEESFIKGVLKEAFSINTDKLNKIIDEMKDNGEGVAKLAQIVEARIEKGAREDAMREWEEAKLERIENRKERQAASNFREELRQEQQDDHYRKFCSWLASQEANGFNTGRHNTNVSNRAKKTCQWLLANSDYIAWKEAHTATSNSTSASILWVHGLPGSGKTFLCSRAIQEVQETYPDAAVIYHFFQFDKSNTAVVTLKILADRLFQIYWDRHQRVSEELYSKTQRNSFLAENIEEVIELLVKDLASKVFFFIDGLDEELDIDSRDCPNLDSRWDAALSVLRFIIGLAERFPHAIRLWYSSQYHPRIEKAFRKHTTGVLDIKDEARGDVEFYLLDQLAELEEMEVSREQKEDVMVKLAQRAREEGNFLWARFMVSDLREVADDLTKIKEFIAGGHPSSIDDHYKRIFSRIDTRHRQLACKVFALISFARRPLRIKEIREAVGILRSRNNPRESMPFTSKLKNVFAPLIEVQRSANNASEDYDTCHLFHSTVRTYLDKHPEIFKCSDEISTDYCRMTPNVIADACLSYLSQDCYAKLLWRSSDDKWSVRYNNQNEPVEDHPFLVYSAKYWNRHVDDLNALDSPNLMKERVRSFMISPNFQTCLQVQSVWFNWQFETFWTSTDSNRTFLRRVLPQWFIESEDTSFRLLLQNYRLFLREWRYFLRGHCDDPGCTMLRYDGQVDRCWWAALGPRNFLSRMQGRYTSFAFKVDGNDAAAEWEKNILCENVCMSGTSVKILRLKSHDRISKSLIFVCEHWVLNDVSMPVLVERQTIQTDEISTNWLAYVNGYNDEPSKCALVDTLRLGAQIFVIDQNGHYIPVEGVEQAKASLQSSCFEEWAIRGHHIVLATRRRENDKAASGESLKTQSISRDREGNPDEIVEEEEPDHVDGDDEGDDESLVSDDSAVDEDEDEAYESWSDCSTEYSDDLLFEDDMITPWARPENEVDGDRDPTESDEESSETDETQSESGDDNTGTEEDSDSDFDPSAIIGYRELHHDDEDTLWDTNDHDDHGRYSWQRNHAFRSDHEDSDDLSVDYLHRRKPKNTGPIQDGMRATITVFDIRSCAVRKVFHFSQQIHYELYDSPPVIHPTSSLIVWPLSSGEVLFADFIGNTYLSRRLRPSTAHTRQIFMKCRFSTSGQYLHVACLEGQSRPRQRKKENGSVKLALMVSTYRLCMKKTSRSPPTLIHRARISLGAETSISVSNLPCTLTWTTEALYLTYSNAELRVYRVSLFNPNKGILDGSIPSVLVPEEAVFLPGTAQKRKVYFFPSDDDRLPSKVIVGSETSAENQAENEDHCDIEIYYGHSFGPDGSALSPPIGCYLKKSDLGGWVQSKDRSRIPENLGIGQFESLLEKFNPDDDCDRSYFFIVPEPYLLFLFAVEPYLFG
ncbi:hypothetical protein EV421DRAFT_1952359 [Armillaria borealis]|uniref:Nephrocystin 3-like N-terminal domain-containing protein n=1 Tax=Armillaria borealis TaxID=47425 RepID=A0AA39JFK2_9AGAR|nr:hypothetical protein EV421DRAFT_1952359 [Armillaria borealis]